MNCKKCNVKVTERDIQVINGRPFCKPCSKTVTYEDAHTGKTIREYKYSGKTPVTLDGIDFIPKCFKCGDNLYYSPNGNYCKRCREKQLKARCSSSEEAGL